MSRRQCFIDLIKFKQYQVEVLETRVVKRLYFVEAESGEEALELAGTGDTVDEADAEDDYEVTDRTVRSCTLQTIANP